MVRRLLAAAALLGLVGCDAYYNAWSPDDLMKSIPLSPVLYGRVSKPNIMPWM